MRKLRLKTSHKAIIGYTIFILFFGTLASVLFWAVVIYPKPPTPLKLQINASDIWNYNMTYQIDFYSQNEKLLETIQDKPISVRLFYENQTYLIRRLFHGGGELANITITKSMQDGDTWRLSFEQFKSNIIAGQYTGKD